MGCCCSTGLIPYHMTAAGRAEKARQKKKGGQVVPGEEGEEEAQPERKKVRPVVNPMLKLRMPAFIKEIEEEQSSPVDPAELADMRKNNQLALARQVPKRNLNKPATPPKMLQPVNQLMRSIEMFYRESAKMPNAKDRATLKEKEQELLNIAKKIVEISNQAEYEARLGASEADWKKAAAKLKTAQIELDTRKEVEPSARTPKANFGNVLDGLQNAVDLLIEETSKVKNNATQMPLFELQSQLLTMVNDVRTTAKLWKVCPKAELDEQLARLKRGSDMLKAYGLAADIDYSDESEDESKKIGVEWKNKNLSAEDRREIQQLRALRGDTARLQKDMDRDFPR